MSLVNSLNSASTFHLEGRVHLIITLPWLLAIRLSDRAAHLYLLGERV